MSAIKSDKNTEMLPAAQHGQGNVDYLVPLIEGNEDLMKKVVDAFAEQTKHRIVTEKEILARSHQQQILAQCMTFSISLTGLICGTYLGATGNPWAAGVVAIVGIGGPPAALALAKRINRQ